MASSFPSPRSSVVLAILVSLFAGTSVIPVLIPDVAAATSRDKAKISKLKKSVKKLKKQLLAQRSILVPVNVPIPGPEAPFIEMVTVGNIGNAVDSTSYGAVSYEYQIGKYEVTLNQYAAFLNAVAKTDTAQPSGLYHTLMAAPGGGIARFGSNGGYTYVVYGVGELPVTFVNWFNAARFCNWLHNGRPAGLQDTTTTEDGAYSLNGATSGVGFSRNPGAKYWIPSEDEWYKAAYHDPRTDGEGGPPGNDNYWLYPTASDSPPGNMIGAEANRANYYTSVAAVTQDSGSPISAISYSTAVGAYSDSASYYGTFDQGGNVEEWNEVVINGSSRGVRGGSWYSNQDYDLRSSVSDDADPSSAGGLFGFRVASP